MAMLDSLQQGLYQSPDILPLVFLLLLSFIFISWNRKVSKEKESKLPPSPPKLPIIGNLHQLGTHPHRSLQSLAQTHGPFMLIHLGSTPYLVASTAAAAKEILQTHDLAFSSRFKSVVIERCSHEYKDVAFAPYGEYWRQAKKVVVLHLLSATRVRSFRPVREEEVSAMLDKIRRASNTRRSTEGGVGLVNVSDALADVVFDISCRVFLGSKYTEEDLAGGEKGVRAAVNELMDVLGKFDVGDFIPWLAWVNRLNGFYSRLDEVARKVDVLMDRVVEDHIARRRCRCREMEEESMNVGSFVDVMLALAEEEESGTTNGFSLDRDAMKALLQDMFVGGTHTVFTVMDWGMTELMRHPRVMRKLQAEVRETCRGKKMATEDDTERMTYLKCVVKEVLRLHSTLPFLVPHESMEDVELGQGYRIPKGTRVMVNAWAVARDPEFWERPEEFSPERFLDSPVDFRGSDFQFIPFGAGRRGCPGTNLSIATIELVLANLVYSFEWELPDGLTAENLDFSEASGLIASRRLSLILKAKPYLA